MRTLIDTRLWVLGLKRAIYPEGSEERQLGEQAQAVIDTALEGDMVLVSGQLVAEIFAVATGRGMRLRADVAADYVEALLTHPSVRAKATRLADYRDAVRLSRVSGVHLWDFLVVLPFGQQIDRILTMDPHFRNPAFEPFGRVENPLGVWKVEGQR